jgi:hypothetical protein
MAGIFISYRQQDAKAWAIGLRNDLAKAFGKENVFLDKEDLGPGSWQDQIQRALNRCNVVLVAIGPRWLTIVDEQNRPRLTLPDDVHRQEIALALRHQGTTVIPILFDDAVMPKAEQLPDDIRGLAGQQAYKIGDVEARREADLDLLIKAIEPVSGLVARKPTGQLSWIKFHATAVLFSVGITAVLVLYYTKTPNPLNRKEILVSFVIIYAMTVVGKFLRRYFRG